MPKPVTIGARFTSLVKCVVGGSTSTKGFTAVLFFGLCLAMSSCKDSEQIWSAEAKSPDNNFVATAQTLQPGGWGTGSPAQTIVALNWTTGSQKPTVIFTFVGKPEDAGSMNVGMNWLTPTHLELTYRGHPIIEFQAVKCYRVDISIREATLSSATAE